MKTSSVSRWAASPTCAPRNADQRSSPRQDGTAAPLTLHNWVTQAERNAGKRAGPTSEERDRIKALERENRELRQANEILRKASAYFALAELDRRSKT